MSRNASDGKRGVKIIHLSTSDWDDACAGMTCEEEGVFWRIIRLMYRQGGPVRDDDRLPHALRIDPRSWRRLRAALQTFDVLEWIGGWIISKRVQKELGKVAEQREQASVSGKKGNQKRWPRSVDKAVDDFGLQPELPFTSSQLDPQCDRKEPAKSPEISDNSLKNKDPLIATPTPTPIDKKNAREAQAKGEVEKVPEVRTGSIWLVDDRIVLDPAQRAIWLPHFANSDTALDLGLLQAAGYIARRQRLDQLSPTELGQQVLAQLAQQVLSRTGSARPTGPTQTAGQRAALDGDRKMQDALARVLASRRTTPAQ